MKTDIHPNYAETHVRCSCGNTLHHPLDQGR